MSEAKPAAAAPAPLPAAGHAPARLPAWVLVGALLGVVAGLVFGERMKVFEPVGVAYATMLEIPVYPYVICSLLHGLGRLPLAAFARLLRASWAPYVALWAMTFGAIWLVAQAIPAPPPPHVLTPPDGSTGPGLVDLLIPGNLFAALGANYVPAVVVFAIVYGVAIQRIRKKEALLETLDAIRAASVSIWGWVVYVSPIGVFALFAATAGSVAPERAASLALYVILFLVTTAILAFVVLPMVMAALAPASWREILDELKPALVLAAVTTLSSVTLPFVQRAAERILARAGIGGTEEAADVIATTVSVSYVFAPVGNYFVYLLILYAGFQYETEFSAGQQALLPFMSLLSSVGSPSATVDSVVFLSEWLRLPPGTLDIYIDGMTITRYGQVVASVMGFGFVAVLIPLIFFRRLRPGWGKAGGAVALGLVLCLAVWLGGGRLSGALFPPPADAGAFARTLDPDLVGDVEATVHDTLPPPDPPPATAPTDALDAIRQRGVLRVGYSPATMPFSYRNAAGDLVGFDVSFAYRLARDLKVGLEFLPFDFDLLEQQLAEHRFDIAMSGLWLTDDRLRSIGASDPYYHSPMALIARAEVAPRFLAYDEIRADSGLRLATFRDPVLIPMLARLFPNASITVVDNYIDGLDGRADIDAAIWTLEQAAQWSEAHPGYTAVGPSDMGEPLLFAYLLPPDSEAFRRYVNLWLDLKQSDGFHQAQVDYWLDGKPRAPEKPRWNLLDNVILAGSG